MPNPPPPSASSTGAVDPHWKFFLEHVHREGSSYAIKVPANGATPSYVLKYEKARVPNGEARSASAASPSGARGKRRKLEKKEEKDSSAEAPGKRWKLEKKKKEKVKKKKMEKEKDSSAEAPWYDSFACIDEDYRFFLKHTRFENGRMVLEYEDHVVKYDVGAARPGGSSEAEEEVVVVVEVIRSDGPAVSASEPDLHGRHAPEEKVKEDEDDQEENDEVEEVDVPASGGNVAMEDEIGSDLPA